ncbi:MAG: IS30 family transposase [Pseudonocardiaceae bacterium]
MTRWAIRAERREFWLRVRDGASFKDAAVAIGLNRATGPKWVRQAGGVAPAYVTKVPAKGRYLCLSERIQIQIGISMKLSIREIARGLGRAPSTVQRELDRNSRATYRARPHARKMSVRQRGVRFRGPNSYNAHSAQRWAEKRVTTAADGRPTRLASGPALRDRVQHLIGVEDFSPRQVAAQLRIEFPDDPEMWVSHETIYKALYVQGRGELRRDLHKRLRTGRALRKPRRRTGERQSRFEGMVNISERPPEVADRAVPGHWEGDLITGKNNASAIGTLVERSSRFVMLLHLPGDHGADAVQEAMVTKIAALPEAIRRSLTWDQGAEMANHLQIAEATGMDIYFCDPGSPWQRGTNENTNGLLRQYFPKGTDLSGYPADYLDYVANKLNQRPRETLDWKTPAQALDELLSQPPHPGVASLA